MKADNRNMQDFRLKTLHPWWQVCESVLTLTKVKADISMLNMVTLSHHVYTVLTSGRQNGKGGNISHRDD